MAAAFFIVAVAGVSMWLGYLWGGNGLQCGPGLHVKDGLCVLNTPEKKKAHQAT